MGRYGLLQKAALSAYDSWRAAMTTDPKERIDLHTMLALSLGERSIFWSILWSI